MSFMRAIRCLDLGWEDSANLAGLIMDERAKMKRYDDDIARYPISEDFSWLDDFTATSRPALVTDLITDQEVRSGRSFLSFMGLNDIAATLGYYQGTSAGSRYDIPLNHFVEDGPRCLLPHFNVGCSEEIWEMAEAEKRRPRLMSAHELLVRMDAPPGTVNPRRVDLRFQAYDWERWGNPVPDERPAGGLHPASYNIHTRNGAPRAVLDNSPTPEELGDEMRHIRLERRQKFMGEERTHGADKEHKSVPVGLDIQMTPSDDSDGSEADLARTESCMSLVDLTELTASPAMSDADTRTESITIHPHRPPWDPSGGEEQPPGERLLRPSTTQEVPKTPANARPMSVLHATPEAGNGSRYSLTQLSPYLIADEDLWDGQVFPQGDITQEVLEEGSFPTAMSAVCATPAAVGQGVTDTGFSTSSDREEQPNELLPRMESVPLDVTEKSMSPEPMSAPEMMSVPHSMPQADYPTEVIVTGLSPGAGGEAEHLSEETPFRESIAQEAGRESGASEPKTSEEVSQNPHHQAVSPDRPEGEVIAMQFEPTPVGQRLTLRECSPSVVELAERCLEQYKHLVSGFDKAEGHNLRDRTLADGSAAPAHVIKKKRVAVLMTNDDDEEWLDSLVANPANADKDDGDWKPKKRVYRKRPRSSSGNPPAEQQPVKKVREVTAPTPTAGMTKKAQEVKRATAAANPTQTAPRSKGRLPTGRPRGRPRKNPPPIQTAAAAPPGS